MHRRPGCPTCSRWLAWPATLTALALLGLSSVQAEEVNDRFRSAIEVSRILVTARVTDRSGTALPNLAADDFAVEIDGRPVEVESAVWIGQATDERALSRSVNDVTSREVVRPPAGRLLVLMFQVDLRASRMPGIYRMSRRAARMLDELDPADRVAVAVFTSHFELHADFTTDHRGLADELRVHSLLERRQQTDASDDPDRSLAAHLDFDAAGDAANLSQGLRVLAEALGEIEGRKSIALFGYGLGRLVGGSVRLGRDYDLARDALGRADVTVFSLDVTDADYHSLEVGLQALADETGGFYARTHLFPGIAMARLGRALAGLYQLSLIDPGVAAGSHKLEVRGPAGSTVMARPVVEVE